MSCNNINIDDIRIVGRLYFEDNSNSMPITADSFRKLMFLITPGIFLYKNKLYKQIDGATMGNLLGPILANSFSGCIKQKLVENKSD